MKKSKYQQYFYYFIDYILVPCVCVFWLSYQYNIVTILINVAIRVSDAY